MPELDKDRLAKLLSMTSSEHDAEALAAIRKANELLRGSRKTWFDAVGASTSALDPPRAEAPRYAPRPAGPPPPPPGFQRLRVAPSPSADAHPGRKAEEGQQLEGRVRQLLGRDLEGLGQEVVAERPAVEDKFNVKG